MQYLKKEKVFSFAVLLIYKPRKTNHTSLKDSDSSTFKMLLKFNF